MKKLVNNILAVVLLTLVSCKQPVDTGQWVEWNIDKINYDYLINNDWALEEIVVDKPNFKRYIFSYNKDTMPTELHLTISDSITHIGIYFTSKNGWSLRAWENNNEITDSLTKYCR